MNPSFMALAKIKPMDMLNIFIGKHVPKDKRDPNVGPAFAKNHGTQQIASGSEKEANIDRHLAQLRSDVFHRTGYIGGGHYNREGYTSYKREEDLINICIDKEMNEVINAETPTKVTLDHLSKAHARFRAREEDNAAKRHEAHKEYIAMQVAANKRESMDPITEDTLHARVIPVTTYLRSDLIEALEEAQAERDAEVAEQSKRDAEEMAKLYGSDKEGARD